MDETAVGYQVEGVIKILKYIRDGLAGGVNRPNNDDNDDNNDGNNDGKIEEEKKYVDMPYLETEEEAAKRTENFYQTKLKDSELSNEEKDELNNED